MTMEAGRSAERFLVTGALGCIGAWTVRQLVGEGVPVVAFDLGTDPRRLALIMSPEELGKVTFVSGDITDPGSVQRAPRDALRHQRHPPRRAAGAVLPGGSAARRPGQRHRHGQRVRGRQEARLDRRAGRLLRVDRHVLAGRRGPGDRTARGGRGRPPEQPLRRLQAGQRGHCPGLLAGQRRRERRPPTVDGLWRGTGPGS